MIIITITNRKKPVVYSPAVVPPVVHTQSLPYVTNLAFYNEAKRRNAIIKDLVKTFNYKKGDKVECANPDDTTKWGQCTIIGILDDYQHMEKDHKWPANDNPLIVTAAAEDGSIFFATTNYFKDGVNDSAQAS